MSQDYRGGIMKKICFLFLFLFLVNIVLTGCSDQYGAPYGLGDRTFPGIPPGGPPPVELPDGVP